MSKVFDEKEKKILWKKDRQQALLFTEAFVVKYTYISKINGFSRPGEKMYFAASKNKHDVVEKRFIEDMKKTGLQYTIISIVYQ